MINKHLLCHIFAWPSNLLCGSYVIAHQKHSPEFVKLDSAAMGNDTFTAHLMAWESRMHYNVSLEPGHFAPSIMNITIQVDQNKAVVELNEAF
uniref:Uncharacterized protein n=1 Tax=Romanomermis culicivorax TaxID=13658 RepID=A0A915KYN4_ROMCU